MIRHPKPSLVLSKCLELDACRYNGVSIQSGVVRALLPHIDVRPVCPEVEIGLGTPRDPINLIGPKERPRLVQPSTGRDLTKEMVTFAKGYLGDAGDIDGFILKSRSPSCGIKDTKIHATATDAEPLGTGAGLFGAAVKERYPHAAIEDEGQLNDFRLRHHFLTKLFLRARFREMRRRRTMAALVGFHATNKFVLLAYHQAGSQELGRIVANAEKDPVNRVLGHYANHLTKALERPARAPATVNVLMHILGMFSERLTATERADFLAALAEYRQGKVPLDVPLQSVHQWARRFDDTYVAKQTFLEPYPRELTSLNQ